MILDIYKNHLKYHEKIQKKIFDSIGIELNLSALIYTRSFASGVSVDMPIIFHEHLMDWAIADGRVPSYQELIRQPAIVSFSDLSLLLKSWGSGKYLSEFNDNPLSLLTQDRLMLLPVRHKYHFDRSISLMCGLVEKKKYLAISGMWQIEYDRIINAIERYLWQENPKMIDDYLVASYTSNSENFNLEPYRKFSKLTKAENMCFIAIANGCYEGKQIAEFLGKSIRTVQDLIQSMLKKLNLNSRYELYIEISQAEEHLRYLMLHADFHQFSLKSI